MLDTQTKYILADRAEDDDASLIAAAQRDPLLFEPIYTRWAAPIYRYFSFRTANQADAEDLTSQLFLTALQALPRYQHQGHFAAWLFTIARNLSHEFHRKTSREIPLEHARAIEAPSDPPGEAAQANEIRALRKLIYGLPEEDQELIRLRYVAELSFADMALVLGKREDAVKKSLYRLQARLQSLLEPSHD